MFRGRILPRPTTHQTPRWPPSQLRLASNFTSLVSNHRDIWWLKHSSLCLSWRARALYHMNVHFGRVFPHCNQHHMFSQMRACSWTAISPLLLLLGSWLICTNPPFAPSTALLPSNHYCRDLCIPVQTTASENKVHARVCGMRTVPSLCNAAWFLIKHTESGSTVNYEIDCFVALVGRASA